MHFIKIDEARSSASAVTIRFITISFMAMFFITAAGCSQDDPSLEELQTRVQKLETTVPGVGSTMFAVQIHFGKLYFAGQARNWELAGYELYEVEENLDKSATLRPEEHGVSLAELTDAFKQAQLSALRVAIEAEDAKAFRAAYEEAMSVCNACHMEVERPFLVITLPDAPPVTNQQWEVPGSLTQTGSEQ